MPVGPRPEGHLRDVRTSSDKLRTRSRGRAEVPTVSAIPLPQIDASRGPRARPYLPRRVRARRGAPVRGGPRVQPGHQHPRCPGGRRSVDEPGAAPRVVRRDRGDGGGGGAFHLPPRRAPAAPSIDGRRGAMAFGSPGGPPRMAPPRREERGTTPLPSRGGLSRSPEVRRKLVIRSAPPETGSKPGTRGPSCASCSPGRTTLPARSPRRSPPPGRSRRSPPLTCSGSSTAPGPGWSSSDPARSGVRSQSAWRRPHE